MKALACRELERVLATGGDALKDCKTTKKGEESRALSDH